MVDQVISHITENLTSLLTLEGEQLGMITTGEAILGGISNEDRLEDALWTVGVFVRARSIVVGLAQ